MQNHNYAQRLLSYLSTYPSEYLIIGGTAAELELDKRSLPFRQTKDFDIVICWNGQDRAFPDALASLIRDGRYRTYIRNSKKSAYRFENAENSGFPSVIELFCKSGAGTPSLDGHLAKMNIPIDDDRLSAIVLEDDLYAFAVAHRIGVDGLSVLDIYGLLLLKCVAYFRNYDLFLKGKVDKRDYLKHRRDVIALLGALKESEVQSVDHPTRYDADLKAFSALLQKAESAQVASSLGYRGRIYSELCRSFRILFSI